MKEEFISAVSYVIGTVLILGSVATIIDTFKRSCINFSSSPGLWSCGSDDFVYKVIVWSVTFFVFYGVYKASK